MKNREQNDERSVARDDAMKNKSRLNKKIREEKI
jgi:hypothetical protein